MNAEDRFDDVVSRRTVVLSNYLNETIKSYFCLRFFLGHGKTQDAELRKVLLELWNTYQVVDTVAIAAQLTEDQIPSSFLQSGLYFMDIFLGYIAVPDKRRGGPYTVTMEIPLWCWNQGIADRIRAFEPGHSLGELLLPGNPSHRARQSA